MFVLDLPGHGRSHGPGRETIAGYAEAVVSLLDSIDALRGKRTVVGGHSMGGAIAQVVALNYPERVAGLVLIGTGAKLRVAPVLMDGVLSQFETVLALIADWSFGPSAPTEMKRLVLKAMRETDPAVLHADYRACGGFDILDRLSEINAPTLVVGGATDRMTPLRFSQYLANNIPRAELQVVEGAGHMMALEQPDAVATAVSEFMAGLESENPQRAIP